METGDTQATDRRLAMVYVVRELSRSGWFVAIQAAGERQPSRHKLIVGDAKRSLALVAEARRAVARLRLAPKTGTAYSHARDPIIRGISIHAVDERVVWMAPLK